MDKYKVLKEVFGYDTFREGQEGLIDSTLAGRDVLGIMPTGAGKSICFQVPALLFQGITIVVSPLISLMKDQVAALNAAGVHAAFINSSLTEGQYRKAMEFAARGRYKIIYAAPERLMTDSFLALVNQVEISMVAVEEAHCISQWGFPSKLPENCRIYSGFAETPCDCRLHGNSYKGSKRGYFVYSGTSKPLCGCNRI